MNKINIYDVFVKLLDDNSSISYKFKHYVYCDYKSGINDLIIYYGYLQFLDIYYGMGEEASKKFDFNTLLDCYNNFYSKIKNKKKFISDTLSRLKMKLARYYGKLGKKDIYDLYFIEDKKSTVLGISIDFINYNDFCKGDELFEKFKNYTEILLSKFLKESNLSSDIPNIIIDIKSNE